MIHDIKAAIASLWGNACAWASAGGAWLYGGMEPITALGATAALVLTVITIMEKLCKAKRDSLDDEIRIAMLERIAQEHQEKERP